VLIFRSARMASAARFGAAAALSAITLATIWSAAYADGMIVGGCVRSGAVNCVVRWGEAGDPYVRLVPAPTNEADKALSAARDRKWKERCRPTILQDRLGVPRYQYAAPGCEFGVIE
jgi:hypothetical protein